MMNYAVLLAGGSGTRLWPMSRAAKPKQLHNLVSKKTLLQETFERVAKAVPTSCIYIATLKKYQSIIRQQLPALPKDNFIIEPVGKNTAPAIGYLSALISRRDPEAIIATFSSDHLVDDKERFAQIVKAGFWLAGKYPDHLVVIGLKPTWPETGFGYIKLAKTPGKIGREKFFKVESFTEKPDLKTAQGYLASGRYLWNASYFIFKAQTMLSWMEKFLSKTKEKIEEVAQLAGRDWSEVTPAMLKKFASISSGPIETAIVEKLSKVLVIPADFGWSDIGNWGIVHETLAKKNHSNIISRGQHIDIDSEEIMVYGDKKLIATVGLKNIIVIDSPEAILILNKDKSQDVKKVVEILKTKKQANFL